MESNIELITFGTVGVIDKYFINNPQASFFKAIYAKSPNIGHEISEITLNPGPIYGRKCSGIVIQKGDLLTKCYMELVLPDLGDRANTYVYGAAHELIKSISFNIGSNCIETLTGDFLNIWGELTTPLDKLNAYDANVSNRFAIGDDADTRYYVEIPFFFSRSGLYSAIPLLNLSSQEIKINIEFDTVSRISNGYSTLSDTNNISGLFDCKLFVEYIYLDTEHRRQLLHNNSYQKLIEQVKSITSPIIPADTRAFNVDLSQINSPVRELIWVHAMPDNTAPGSYPDKYGPFDYKLDFTGGTHSFTTATLRLDGLERFSARYADYFHFIETGKYHTHIPRTPLTIKTYMDNDYDTNVANYHRHFIYTYSFSLNPENPKYPSGHLNFNKYSKKQLVLTYPGNSRTFVCKVFLLTYNIIEYKNGIVNLLY